MTEREIFGQRVAKLRSEKKLSQLQLSKLSGVSNVNISRIEDGKYSVGLDVLLRLGKALGKELIYN